MPIIKNHLETSTKVNRSMGCWIYPYAILSIVAWVLFILIVKTANLSLFPALLIVSAVVIVIQETARMRL